MIVTHVVLLSPSPSEVTTALRVDGLGRVLSREALSPEAPLIQRADRTVLVVPGSEVSTLWLAVPPGSPVQVAAAAALMMEERLATPSEAMHLSFGPDTPEGRLTVAVDRLTLAGWLERAEALGLQLDAVIPDHLALPEPAEADAVLAVVTGGVWVVRGQGIAFTAEPDLADLLLEGRQPTAPVTDPDGVETLFAAGALTPSVDLLHSSASREDEAADRRRLRRAAALVGLALVSPLLIWGAEAARKTAAASSLDDRSEARAQAALSVEEAIPDPVSRLQAQAQRQGAAGGLARAAAPLLSAVAALETASVRSLVYTSDGALRATVAHANYSDVDALRSAAAGAGLLLEQGGASTEGDRIVTDLVVRPQP